MVDTLKICDIAKQAGEAILKFYNQEKIEVNLKSHDNSPVTAADLAANEIIVKELSRLYPHIPILSEENLLCDYEERKKWTECFIVDPLDGTKEFIKKNGDFTVNIAYIKNRKVHEGVIYAPVKNILYYSRLGRAYKKMGDEIIELPIKPQKRPFTVVESRSHKNTATENFIANLKTNHPDLVTTTVGSSLKFCMLCDGRADLYPRLGSIMEWDVAAAHGIIKACGGDVVDFHTQDPLKYNKKDLHVPWFVASVN